MNDYRSLVDRTVADLQRQICNGQLKPGQRLSSERRLCTALGISRTTVREALKSLVVQGFVTRTGRGAVVADPDTLPGPRPDLASLAAQVSIRDLYAVRKLIEVRVAAWAAVRATESDIEEIRCTVEAEGSRAEQTINPNTAFHDALVKAAHNPVLLHIYMSSRNLFFRLPFFWKLFDESEIKTVRKWRHELARRWHKHILHAIEEHDPEEAEGAMFQHLDVMEKDLLSRLRIDNGEASRRGLYHHPMLVDSLMNESSRLKG